MRVTTLFFASLRESAGSGTLELEVSAGATVRDVAAQLEREIHGLTLKGALCAVNEAYSRPDSVLAEGDRLAFLPPVAGG